MSVIVPFAGPPESLEQLVGVLMRLTLRDDDEVIVAHNRRPSGHRELRGRVLVLGAGGLRSPAYARNQAAGIARGRWLVFLDADTTPDHSLVERLFQPPPGERTSILAGRIEDVGGGTGLLARHTLARRPMSQELTLSRPGFGYAQTANCAVRADAFASVGGFVAGARAGEDADLCLRLQKAGWLLEPRHGAVVTHRGRHMLRGRLAQLARHGAGAAWVERRHPGAMPPPRPLALGRRLGSEARATIRELRRGRGEAAAFHALDLLGALAFELGRLAPNRARPERRTARDRPPRA